MPPHALARTDAAVATYVVLCLVGLVTGLRGLEKLRRATRFQRGMAAAGVIISLLAFMVLTAIAILAYQ